MSVMDSKKLNLQTSWNMEMPYEMMLGLKDKVPAVVEIVSTPAASAYTEMRKLAHSLERSVENAGKQGKVMFKRAIDNLAAVDPSSVSDKAIMILKEYQKKVEIVLDAVVKFLRETKFQIPGFEQRVSGLEVYRTFSGFVADITEEAMQKVPDYLLSCCKAVIDHIESTEFTIPGSSYILSGREILADLSVALRKVQAQVIVMVNKVRDMQLEDIMSKCTAFMRFTVDQIERFFQTLKAQNVEMPFTFLTNLYNDAVNSDVMADVARQVEVVHKIVLEYITAVKVKLQSIVAEMSREQLQVDIKSWIDTLLKRVNTFQNNVIQTLKEQSKTVEPYVRVGDHQMEVDIPLPFVSKFN